MWFYREIIKKKILQTSSKRKFEDFIVRSLKEYKKNNRYIYDVKINEVVVFHEEVKTMLDKEKVDFLLYNIQEVQRHHSLSNKSRMDEYQRNLNHTREGYIKQLLRNKLIMDEEDIVRLYDAFSVKKELDWTSLSIWPLSHMLNQIYSQYKEKGISPTITAKLNDLKSRLKKLNDNYYAKEKAKWFSKIDDILYIESESPEASIRPDFFVGDDEFTKFANDMINALPEPQKPFWYRLVSFAKKANGSKPSKKFLSESKLLIKEVGNDKFKKIVEEWLLFIVNLKEKVDVHTSRYGDQEYRYSTYEFLSPSNTDAIKGFIWMCSHFHNKQSIQTTAQLAERAFKKIPGKGPAAAAIGNACLYVLYKSKGLDGIGQLSRLKLRIRQASTQTLITKYLQEAAREQGVSISEIEDLSVDDFGLTDAKKEMVFDDYKALIEIERIGKTTIKWHKPDGSPQKSIPKFVNEKHKAKLKKLKDSVKQINQTTSAQRDRLDRMFKSNRVWKWDDFSKLYLNHGLMSFFVKKILWNFHQNGEYHTAYFHKNHWKDIDGNSINAEGVDTVTLWHPIQATVKEIEAWRNIFAKLKIQQPIKQVFREVYILTDAEINTKSYSNRMAAHILKQHQFNSLAKVRGWSYSLLGAFDNGQYNDAATIEIPEFEIKAEYWINEVNADDAFNDTGIWDYIATDQVRFISTATNDTIDLIDVPDIVFSEVLRDIDLFVGVASVGNDPTWQDSGGIPRYNDYWENYSFGDLSEIAKTRKSILENLVPRLKINKVASIQDKFLVVKGKLRTYKIHIGSTNILMEPNNQYLCIVPDRSKNSKTDLYLPFEGDSGLSVVLSKAFLLAEDDKITDSTITSQINRK